MQIFKFVLLAGTSLLLPILQSAYKSAPLKELKIRARQNDWQARLLHKAAAHGASLDLFLEIMSALAFIGFAVLAVLSWPLYLSFISSFVLFSVSFIYLPSIKPSRLWIVLAAWLSPLIGRLVGYLQPVLSWANKSLKLNRHQQLSPATKEELIKIIKSQKKHASDDYEKVLDLAVRALKFNDKSVKDVMTPRAQVRTLKPSEAIGPMLADELYKTGFSHFPVVGKKKNEVLGTLNLSKLIEKLNDQSAQKIQDIMSPHVYFANETLPLTHVLDARIKTKHQLFVVVNSFEDVVGVISIDDILKEIIGEPSPVKFDNYDDRVAVAKHTLSTDALQSDDEMVE